MTYTFYIDKAKAIFGREEKNSERETMKGRENSKK